MSEPSQGQLRALLHAALWWWESKRPEDMAVEAHVQNPAVNATAPAEHRLATVIGAIVKAGGLDEESGESEVPPFMHEIDSIGVHQWSPGAVGAGVRPTQVHMLINLKGSGVPLVMRFKSPAALGRFIGSLRRHREGVWPME